MLKKSVSYKRINIVFCLFLSFCLFITSCNRIEQYRNSTDAVTETGKNKETTAIRRDFNKYLAEAFKSEVTSSTINLHYTLAFPAKYGIVEYPITYGYIPTQTEIEAAAVLENMKAALESFDIDLLSTSQKITYDILMDYAEKEISGTDLFLYQEILRPSTGIQAELPVLMAEYAFYQEQDVIDYLALLKETPDYFQQIILFENAKSEAGLFMPDFAADNVIAQCSNFIEEPESNYLLDTFNDRIDEMSMISEEEKAVYKNDNKVSVIEYVIPAYKQLIEGMTRLKGTGKNQSGLCNYEKGKEYYGYLVNYYTGSDMTVKEMQKQAEQFRKEDIKAISKLINENPKLVLQCSTYTFDQSDPREILEELQSKMRQDFPAPPDTSFEIKYVHSSLADHMAPAFYLTPPIDNISQNSIYINDSNKYEKMKLYTTLAHEGFPGHLYQNVMERSQSMPAIRSLINCAGYSEGWATYVEMLSYYYADIDQQLAAVLQRDQAAMLSLYASADMGIHYDGWDLEKTKHFFEEYQITNMEAIEGIYKLIIEEPAHYLKYYIGYLEFLNLKEYAKKLFKDGYNEYKYHEALMNMGPAPFDILKEYLPSYYQK